MTEITHFKFVPESLDDLIGNKVQIQEVKECIKEKKPALLYGPPGVGKTTSVHLIAKELGYQLVEFNASDERKKEELEKILRSVQMKSLKPKIFFFDEVDGMYDEYYGRQDAFKMLAKIIDNSKHPIVLACNEIHKIPNYIQERCKLIRFYHPSKREILELIKKHFGNRKDIRYDKISGDVRNSIISVLTGTDPYMTTDPFQEVLKIFRRKEFRFDNKNLWIWLIDNVEKFYEGRQLFEAVKIITDAAFYDNPNLLRVIPPTKKVNVRVEYPYYLQRKKAIENGSNHLELDELFK